MMRGSRGFPSSFLSRLSIGCTGLPTVAGRVIANLRVKTEMAATEIAPAYGVRRALAALLYSNAKRRGLAALHTLRDFGHGHFCFTAVRTVKTLLLGAMVSLPSFYFVCVSDAGRIYLCGGK